MLFIVIFVTIEHSKTMKHASGSLASAPCSSQKGASFEEGLQHRIGTLLSERDALEEEVRQLRAAVQIYSEVVRRLQLRHSQRAA